MKLFKCVLAALLLLCSTIAYAQPVGYTRSIGYTQNEIMYQGEVDLGYSIGVGLFATNRVNLHTVHGAKINKHLSAGIGLGLDFYHEGDPLQIMMPIFLNVKGYYPINEKFSPYASLDLGYGLGVTDGLNGLSGFYWSPAIGVKYEKFKFQIGYTSQSLSESGVSLNMGAFQFRVGLVF